MQAPEKEFKMFKKGFLGVVSLSLCETKPTRPCGGP